MRGGGGGVCRMLELLYHIVLLSFWGGEGINPRLFVVVTVS